MTVSIDIINAPKGSHVCTSFRDGDWAVFRCPLCEGYERRINVRTGEIKGRSGGSTATHTGVNQGVENMDGLLNVGSKN